MKKIHFALTILAIVAGITSILASWYYNETMYWRDVVRTLEEKITQLCRMYLIDFNWEHEQISPGVHSITVSGIVFNLASVTAYWGICVEVFSANGTKIATENLGVGPITGESAETFTHKFWYTGDTPHTVTVSLPGQNSENAPSEEFLSILEIDTLILLIGQVAIGASSAYLSARFLIARRERQETKRKYKGMLGEVEQNITLSKDMLEILEKSLDTPKYTLSGFSVRTWDAFTSTGFFIDLPQKIKIKLLNLYADIYNTGHLINNYNKLQRVTYKGEILKRINESILPLLKDIKQDLQRLIEN